MTEPDLAGWRQRAERYHELVTSALRAFGNYRPVSHFDIGEIRAEFERYAAELRRLANAAEQREKSPTRREIDALLTQAGVPEAEGDARLGVAARLARYMEGARAQLDARREPPTVPEVEALVRLWEGPSLIVDEARVAPVLVYGNFRAHGVGTLCDVIFVEVRDGRVVACEGSLWDLDDDEVTGFVLLGPKGPLSADALARLAAPDAGGPSRHPIDELAGACQHLTAATAALCAEAGVDWNATQVRDLRGRGWGICYGTVCVFLRASVDGVARPGRTATVRDTTLFYDANERRIVAFTTALRDDAETRARADARQRERDAAYARASSERAAREALSQRAPGERCHAQKDGDCDWEGCPQSRDGEPHATGRHCPYDCDAEGRV